MIVVTGAAGFIGSVIVGYLNKQGITDICCVDDILEESQYKNLLGKEYKKLITTKESIDFNDVDCVIHFGANSSTLSKDWLSLYETNVSSTRFWHDNCKMHNKQFIWASSAAVYGNGNGPMNLYAFSKHISEKEITDGVILRLFNVYGPNEYHKGRMASTIYHWYNQILATDEIKVFEHSDQFCRDFIWVEDVAKTVFAFMNNYLPGTYDLGSGKSTSFEELANIILETFPHTKKTYIPMPEDLLRQYQKNTLADLEMINSINIETASFLPASQGVSSYLDYLKNSSYY
jgi:ADP-L-glycero-D-manno-heptose 6-epimerase